MLARARSLLVVAALLGAQAAHARTGTGDPVEVFRAKKPDEALVLHGHLRLRSAAFFNLDVDRGASPTTGLPLFPEDGAVLGHDARVRVTPSLFLGDELRLFLDVDLLTASLGVPAVNGPYAPPASGGPAFAYVRALGADWLLPFGVLSVGRMTAHFALGIAANDGADLDDDGGDRADRVALVMPLWGALVAAALDVLPDTSLLGEQAVTVGLMRWRAPWEVELYRKAGRAVLDAGFAASVGWQTKDSPGLWTRLLPSATPVVRRDARFALVDLWVRLVWSTFRLESEAWVGDVSIDNPSTLPGVIVRRTITGSPWAFAVVGEARPFDSPALVLQLEGGAASADPAPGFPAAAPTGFSGALPGDAFGPQVDLKRGGDARFDAGRLSALHRIDLILWRTLLGGVSEAAYGRARAKTQPLPGLTVEGNAVYSHALSPASAPGGVAPLGVELDVAAEAALDSVGSSSLRVDAGTLMPLGGLGARGAGPPSWAHMILVRLGHAL